jgi:S1-C subfamily serine protease
MVRLILVALVLVTALTGCSGGSDGGSETAVRTTKEEIIQAHLTGRKLDPIEGIWLWDSGEYEAAIFRDTEGQHQGFEYVAVLTSTKMSGWQIGEVKVALKKTASEHLYAVDYYYSDKSLGGMIATLANDTVLEMNLPQVGRVALVKIYPIKGNEEARSARTGAGFFVTKEVVATNYHLIAEATQIFVTFGGTRLGAKAVAGDKVNDLALLKVEFPGDEAQRNPAQARVRPLTLGEVRYVKQGDKVYAGGFPPDGDASKGCGVYDTPVTSIAALDGDPRLIQVALPFLPLNAGGPLLNGRGEVIGVATSSAGNPYLGVKKEALPAGASLAVKANYLANLLSMLSSEAAPGPSPAGADLSSAQLIERVGNALVLIEAIE